jgi:phosphoesterase RecJ-like protein
MIDHHQNPKNYADLIFSHPDIGSTCELLYEIFMSLNYKKLIDKDISTCLYLGIMTDTGSFQYSSVSSRTHEIVSDLLKNKINNSKIYNKVYNDSSKSRLNILGSALNNLTHLKSYATAYMYINRVDLQRFDYKKGDSEGIVNYGLSLKDVIFCAIFIEDINDDDNVKISFRSIGDFPCNRFAEENFNGGGQYIKIDGGFRSKELSKTKMGNKKVVETNNIPTFQEQKKSNPPTPPESLASPKKMKAPHNHKASTPNEPKPFSCTCCKGSFGVDFFSFFYCDCSREFSTNTKNCKKYKY